ncbi:hypothetical protein BGW42_007453, partial [Actinomortierella wolfii]
MHKTALFLLTLVSATIAIPAGVTIENNDMSKHYYFSVPEGKRGCFCVKNVQTYRITTMAGNTAMVFSSTDCTGNFQSIPSGDGISKAQWVNSISLGESDIPSFRPSGCPN